MTLLRGEAQRIDAEAGRSGIQQSQDDFLAEHGGQRVDAEIDGTLTIEPNLHRAVLGQAALRNIQSRHDLEPGGEAGAQAQRRSRDLEQQPVDAKANPVARLVGLEVDIGGAALDRVVQDLVDETHHGLVVFPDLVERGRFAGQIGLAGVQRQRLAGFPQRFQHAGGFMALVTLGQRPLQLIERHQDTLDRKPSGELQLVQLCQRGREGDRHGEAAIVAGQRQHLKAADDLVRHRLDDRQLVPVDVFQIHERQAILARCQYAGFAGIDPAFTDHQLQQRQLLVRRVADRLLARLRADQSVFDEALGKTALRTRCGDVRHGDESPG